MKSLEKTLTHFAVCMNNAEYPAALERHKIYRVLPAATATANGDVRVIDESGEDYLYPADYFLMIELPQATQRALKRSFSQIRYSLFHSDLKTPRLAIQKSQPVKQRR